MDYLNEVTLTKLSFMLKNRDITIREVVKIYLERIKKIDKGEGKLNSVLELNPDVMTIAKRLEGERNNYNSKLWGIPILLKANIDTADRMHTSAGSLALAKSIAQKDAEIVKVLREKGAIILGKVNMTEFANYMTKGMPAGYSSRGGQVRSPYKKGADPSGSSTGSAVAVTANLCAASIGTDTANSIVSPAIKNGIVGFRPSAGTLSNRGIIPISFTLDTAGPMTRTVMDSATIFSELIGDRISYDSLPEYKNVTVGVNEWAIKNMEEEEEKKAEIILAEIERAGMKIKRLSIEPVPVKDMKVIQRYEFKYAMNQYLSGLSANYPIKTLKDIIEFNQKHEKQALLYGQSLLIDAEENTSGDLKEKEYLLMMEERELKKKQIHEMLKDVDICIMFRENLAIQFTGLPKITIPHGIYSDGMPYGICLTALTDKGLLKHAMLLEQVMGYRVPPEYKDYVIK